MLADLGEAPAEDFEALGLWAAALVNPLPPLGLARELRHDALRSTNSLERLRLVERVLGNGSSSEIVLPRAETGS